MKHRVEIEGWKYFVNWNLHEIYVKDTESKLNWK